MARDIRQVELRRSDAGRVGWSACRSPSPAPLNAQRSRHEAAPCLLGAYTSHTQRVPIVHPKPRPVLLHRCRRYPSTMLHHEGKRINLYELVRLAPRSTRCVGESCSPQALGACPPVPPLGGWST